MQVRDCLIGMLVFAVLLLGANAAHQALVSAHLVAGEHETSSCEVVASAETVSSHTEEK